MTSLLSAGSDLVSRSISSSVISGSDPTAVDPSNPIILFIIQLFIIIVFTQGLGWGFAYLKQPKVIAEVVGGIILGPTVMGRIPHFTSHIFPTASIPYLSLVANIGLVLFLFVVGVEVDIGVMKRNAKTSAVVSVAGMVLPFGLGAAVAVPVYHNFVETDKVSFGHFLLFVGVAMAITAFPVLCRILTSTKLIDTDVGVIVLAAGVGNDVVGWVLLALTLALVGAKSGATAVYILLAAVGWAIILLWPVKKGFYWLARRSGSIDHGPTPGMMLLTLLIIFASAFFTGIIGVHPIFGGFLAGLIIPHEGGFAIALVEKIDDLVALLFLPIYFVISGLQTNLGLLDTGKIWGYIILLIFIGFSGKFVGCAGAAMAVGVPLRESAAIGMLMSCKGLVELIVLNVGLSAGIINQQLFSMFVVVAIVLTFVTTPCTLWIYPEHKRTRGSLTKRARHDDEKTAMGVQSGPGGSGGREQTSKFLVVLQKLEHLSAVMLLTQMLEPPPVEARKPFNVAESISHAVKKEKLDSDHSEGSMSSTPEHALSRLPTVNENAGPHSIAAEINALKLIELTGRTFSVMQSAEKDDLLKTDDVLQLYKQFGRLRGLDITPHISVVGQEQYPNAVADYASDLECELVILPWTVPTSSTSSALFNASTSTNAENQGLSASGSTSQFDSIFGGDSSGSSPMYTHFVRRVFAQCTSDVALFVDRGFGAAAVGSTPGSGQHIFLPFFGGPDDRLALRFVIQLCQHKNVSATIVRVEKPDTINGEEEASSTGHGDDGNGKLGMSESMQIHQAALQSNQLTVGGANTQYPETQGKLASDTADNLAWTYYTSSSSSNTHQHQNRSSNIENALGRIAFWSTTSNQPLSYILQCADKAISTTSSPSFSDGVGMGMGGWRPMLIVVGRGRRGSAINHQIELNKILADKSSNPSIGAELRKTVGDPATALILGTNGAQGSSYLVMEAGKR